MRTLLLEPFGGMAGDMLLAALLDLGDERFRLEHLRAMAEELLPTECELGLHETRRQGLRALRLELRTEESLDPPHRHLSDLLEILERGFPAGRARERAAAVLQRLARAEATVHGIEVEEVHFHEVGAVDTLVDVAGAALALERLEIDQVRFTPPYVGGGTVLCAHGELPVPGPATQELLVGIPFRRGPGGERLTPTAAAFLAACATLQEGDAPRTVERIGLGAGTRDPVEGPPNLLRASVLAADPQPVPRDEAWLLECNLDDATGEEIGFLLAELRSAGALEAWSAAVQMKKDRPGAVVSALARAGDRAALEEVVFAHSPTLGLRWSRTERAECARAFVTVGWPSEEDDTIRVKVRRRAGRAPGLSDLSAEHEDLARAARRSGRSLREIEHEVLARALRRLREDLAPEPAP